MKLLITGICGFVGSSLTRALRETTENLQITGVDNFMRPGSELNRRALAPLGVKILHGDIRSAADAEAWPQVDWVIDAAANPSVLAGVDGRTSSRQLVEHNLLGTVNLLEFCKQRRAGFILLSTSRVYSIQPLADLPVELHQGGFRPAPGQAWPPGLAMNGVTEVFSTRPPLSLYGSTKLASECLALEYGEAFGLPVWINRCGVLAGAGQFGRPDQGIFSFWINSYLRRRPLKYIGFCGQGGQTRDCLHPRDLASVLSKQMSEPRSGRERIQNLSGGLAHSMSLAQLSDWCAARFGRHEVQPDLAPRPFDIPWLVLDSALARAQWGWQPQTSLEMILAEIAVHAEKHPDWLDLSAA
ncbi:MAG TPA: NAD-dependent epimerase/dehydratase family protein [Verrucomicrobiae bacterium]|jgi:CDP-paratose 2-epimerase